MLKLGVIGYGARSDGMLKNLNEFEMGVDLTAVYDINKERATKRIKKSGFDPDKVDFCRSVEEMLERDDLDGICIATNCNSHVDFAEKVLKKDIPLLLEKPVAINMEQLKRLELAGRQAKAPVIVSFPLRYSTLCQMAKEIIDSGELGEISHVEAVNNVSYGRVYYQSWYRDESITGGLFLQKSTHDLDYINYLLGEKPVQLAAMESKQIFKGDRTPGITCDKCPDEKTCPESSHVIINKYLDEPGDYKKLCSFAKDTGNHDSASIMVRYESGVHAVYTQDFVARRDAAKRGAIIIGYKATLEFDWITGEMHIYSHRMPKTTTHVVKNNELFHYGGDKAICENFVEIMQGTGKSIAPLDAGILSALMCIKAKESAQTNKFCDIVME